MKDLMLRIVSNKPLNDNIYDLVLEGEDLEGAVPGQFVQLGLEGFFLRRPISICDIEGKRLRLVYKVFGKGTDSLSKIDHGRLKVLMSLGRGFDMDQAVRNVFIVGGGVGLPPMYFLSKKLIEKGLKPVVFVGFNTKSQSFMLKDFEKIGAEIHVASLDGEMEFKGNAVELFKDYFDRTRPEKARVYACGPKVMLKSLAEVMKKHNLKGEFSLEERMACGFGACMGCSIKTARGMKRVCKEGPVFDLEDIIW